MSKNAEGADWTVYRIVLELSGRHARFALRARDADEAIRLFTRLFPWRELVGVDSVALLEVA
jgi:hypothetical protein